METMRSKPLEQNGFTSYSMIKNDTGSHYCIEMQEGSIPTYMGSRTASETDVIDRPASSSISEKAQDETSRKRKIHRNGSDYDDDDTGDDKSVKTTDDNKKQNHSEIEKRRRDKMNTYISELSGMIPMCHAMSRKLDKLTVLRMAVQHLKAIRGAAPSYAEGRFKPACLSDQELKSLILQTAEGFLFVVGCDRGRILFVSESVSQTLNYTQGDLLGQSWFDILHPKDVAKVKEQLSSSDLSPRERLIDAKTMLPLRSDVLQGASKLCSGARRSFFCRMKYKVPTDVKEESESHSRRKSPQGSDRKYCVIQCTGYLKSWAPVKLGCGALEEAEGEADGDDAGSGSLSCLVAVGRLQGLSPTLLGHGAPPVRTVQFISRHAMDGKFIFVDQRSTLVLGFLPQELLGTSMYEYYHPDDISSLADTHKLALLSSPPVRTPPYRLRTKEGTYVTVQSDWKSFKNPWTKEVECLVAKNSVTLCHPTGNLNNLSENVALNMGAFDFCSHNDEVEIANYINTQVESNKIGCQVAEEALDTQRLSAESPGIGSSPDSLSAEIVTSYVTLQPQDTMAVNSLAISNNLEPLQNSKTLANFEHVRNLTLGNTPDEDIMEMIGSTGNPQASTTLNSSDGNDEAAMAVIMSLLEADAGLGGPVDFSGLPWPLP